MNKQEVKKRIDKLKKVINYHRYFYHVLNKQEISDSALDSLKHELYKLEKKFPELVTSDSPTQRIAGKPLEGFKKVRHFIPMLSIEDVFSEKELKNWTSYLKRLQTEAELEYFVELKIDGFAISLIYEKGLFAYGATRGDGKTGEDVSQNLKTIESIPLKLEIHGKLPNKEIEKKVKNIIDKGRIEIRGEVYMEKKRFAKLNKKLEKRGEKTYSNPRNLAVGSIRQLDPKLAAVRPLDFLAYDIVSELGQKTHFEEHQILPLLGFKTDKGKECKNLSEVINFWKEVSRKRDTFSFQIDGIVVSINDNELFEKLGVVGKSPRGIRAFKFSPKQTTTKILDIKVQIGRTGAVTPVADLEPVEVGGVTISRATLHNEDEIKRLGVKVGDTVIVGRAGDVIPEVISVLPKLRIGKERAFKMPQKCPVCGTELIKATREAVWRCPNPECFARQKKYFYHFISKSAFNIVGLGPKIIDKLIDAGLISDPADLFGLEIGDILPLESLPCRKPKVSLRGFAEKSAKNLIRAIQSRKEINLSRFIYALGIRNVGEQTSLDLVEYFSAQGVLPRRIRLGRRPASGWGSLEKLKKVSVEDLEKIRDIGPVVAHSIYKWFRDKRNLQFLEKLLAQVIIIKPEEIKKKTPVFGKTFLFTGELKIFSRSEAQAKVKELGGKISLSVTNKIDFVVVGKNPGSKYEEAKKLDLKTIIENEFLKLLE